MEVVHHTLFLTSDLHHVLLTASALQVEIKGKRILHDVSFTATEGTWIGILGPNGSGKTTLLRAVNGLLPYSGRLQLHGTEISAWAPRELAQQMAFVRQNLEPVFGFGVEDLVMLGSLPHKRWLDPVTEADRAQVREVLEQLDLIHLTGSPITQLSGGEMRRVFLAQALVQNSPLLLLDEPTAYLDVYHQFDFLTRIRALVESGRTALTVFHDLEQAARYADQLLVLKAGQLMAQGPPSEILTPDLIAAVFRMEVRMEKEPDGSLRIAYLNQV